MQDITGQDLKGLRASALKRIYAAARDAVVAAGIMTADGFDAWARSFAGSDKPRDLAQAGLAQVARIGGAVDHRDPSPETLAQGGFLSGEVRYQPGHGIALARSILRQEVAA